MHPPESRMKVELIAIRAARGITDQHSTGRPGTEPRGNHKDRSARPVRCSAGLCLGMPIEPSPLRIAQRFFRLLPRFGEHCFERALAVPSIDLGRECRVVSIVKGDLRRGDEADAEPIVDTDAEPLLKLADDPVTPMPRVAMPSILQTARSDVGFRRLESLRVCVTVDFQAALPPRHNE